MTKLPEVPSSYKVELTRLASNNANLRTPSIIGVTADLPVVGSGFRIIGASLSKEGDFRMIMTSRVTEAEGDISTEITFKTENSQYRLRLAEDVDG